MLNVYEHKNGGICRYYILNEGIFKQAAAYISMKDDLQECIEAIQYLTAINNSKSIPQLAKSSLLFSSIVKYAKCFTSGEGRGTSLNKEHIFKGKSSQHLDFHNETMDLRHNYLAHAGNKEYESRALIAILNPDFNNKQRETITYAGFKLKDDDSNLDNYLYLYKFIKTIVDKKVEIFKSKVNRKQIKLILMKCMKNLNCHIEIS